MKKSNYTFILLLLIVAFSGEYYALKSKSPVSANINFLKKYSKTLSNGDMNQLSLQQINSFLGKKISNLSSQLVLDSAVAISTSEEKEKVILTHNEMGKVTHELQLQTEGTILVNYSQSMYNYDENGNVVTYQLEYWENNKWEPSRRTNTEYDDQGRSLSSIVERYYGEWEKSTRNIWEYDGNGNNIIWLLESWEENSWQSSSRYMKTFNSNGQVISEVFSYWENGTWKDQSMVSYEYDASGREILYRYESSMENPWFNDYRYITTYNLDGNIETLLLEELEEDNWIKIRLEIYTYDISQNLTSILYQSWENSIWEDSYKDSYTYSENGNITFLTEKWDGIKWIPDDSFFSYRDGLGNSVFIYGSQIVLYLNTITDLNSEKTIVNGFELLQNYPNPFNPSTTIKYTIAGEVRSQRSAVRLIVYDILGREVATLVNKKQKPGNYEVEFSAKGGSGSDGDGSDLTSGIYFYRLQTNEYTATKKMMMIK